MYHPLFLSIFAKNCFLQNNTYSLRQTKYVTLVVCSIFDDLQDKRYHLLFIRIQYSNKFKTKKPPDLLVVFLAPAAGLEPATIRLTVERSAN
jgi:hypothetical protein